MSAWWSKRYRGQKKEEKIASLPLEKNIAEKKTEKMHETNKIQVGIVQKRVAAWWSNHHKGGLEPSTSKKSHKNPFVKNA